MTGSKQRIWQATLSAAHVAWIASVAFFVLIMSAAFLVTGDGHATTFTYVMLYLTDIPILLLGLSKQGTAFPASIFWGAIIGGIAFVYKIVKTA